MEPQITIIVKDPQQIALLRLFAVMTDRQQEALLEFIEMMLPRRFLANEKRAREMNKMLDHVSAALEAGAPPHL